MIVDHADGLHQGVADGRADKVASALFEVFTHSIRLLGIGRYLSQRCPGILPGRPVHIAPEERVKRAELLLNLQDGPGIFNR